MNDDMTDNSVEQSLEWNAAILRNDLKELLSNPNEKGEAFFEHTYSDGNKIYIERKVPTYYSYRPGALIEVVFGEKVECYFEDKPDEVNYMVSGIEYFSIENMEKAIDSFIMRLISRFPGEPTGNGDSLDNILQKVRFKNHYEYCDTMLESFWKAVFEKTPHQMWCAGIVSAHGDKAYSYEETWEEAGIHFYRGVLVFLLSYTPEYKLSDEEKKYQDRGQWVINNYAKYQPMIEAIEKELEIDSENLS